MVRIHHVIFGLSLVCLATLVLWWAVFLNRTINAERQAAVSELQHRAFATALVLGHRQAPPTRGDLPGDGTVDLLPCDAVGTPGVVSAEPEHPDVCFGPSSQALDELDARLRRRRAMVHGEGLFLFLLVCVCVAMLFHMLRLEQRQSQRMESFLHAVTHEMKTPLTGIKTLLETLRSGGVPTEVQPHLLGLGIENADRLEHCIENMLVSGALRSGQQQLHLEPFDLEPQLEAFLEHRRRTLTGRPDAVRVVWDEARDGLSVTADPDMLRIVLENLVDNGLKYGGEQPLVELRVGTAEGQAAIAVTDRGVGFDSTTAERLFVPFLRGLPGGHGVKHGTGLGLALARDLCRRMGGDLQAHSDGPGEGATFTVRLPLADPERSS